VVTNRPIKMSEKLRGAPPPAWRIRKAKGVTRRESRRIRGSRCPRPFRRPGDLAHVWRHSGDHRRTSGARRRDPRWAGEPRLRDRLDRRAPGRSTCSCTSRVTRRPS